LTDAKREVVNFVENLRNSEYPQKMERVNVRKPSWASFFAWPIIGAALSLSVLGAMTIGIFVLPFAIAGLLALRKWGGDQRSSVGLISGAGLPVLYVAYLNRQGPGMICGTYKSGGGHCMEEYSPFPFLLVGTVLVVFGVLLHIRLRNKTPHMSGGPYLSETATPSLKRKFKNRNLFLISILVAILVLITGAYVGALFSTHSSDRITATSPMGKTEAERVQSAFQRMSLDVAIKDHVPSVKLVPVHLGVESYSDGTKASVWVTGPPPKGVRARCFYIDITGNGSSSQFGQSACGGPGGIVSLNRFGPIVVGDIGTLPAVTVFVNFSDLNIQVPVISGYFFVPSAISTNPNAQFTITLIGRSADPIGIVRNLMAPGSAPPK
jgi:hypothetical protein